MAEKKQKPLTNLMDSIEIMTDEVPFAAPEGDGAPAEKGTFGLIGRALNGSRRWFRAFRRSRPFWGAVWMILAGLWIIRAMNFSIGIALTGGWSYAAGYVMGGGLVLFGVVSVLAPHYRTLTGLVGFLVAVAAFPTANLGGYLVGSLLGIIGSSMVWAWGEKKPRKVAKRRQRAAQPEGES